MQVEMKFHQWPNNDINNLDWSKINADMKNQGFCLLQNTANDREILLNLSRACGLIQMHERSDNDGIAEISSNGDLQNNFNKSLFRGLGEGIFPPHTDGSYLRNEVKISYLKLCGWNCSIIPLS
jgi:hypothetical protein